MADIPVQKRGECGRWYFTAPRTSPRILDICTPVFLRTSLSISSVALLLSQKLSPPPAIQISPTSLPTQTGSSASRQPRHPSSTGSQASAAAGENIHANKTPHTTPLTFTFIVLPFSFQTMYLHSLIYGQYRRITVVLHNIRLPSSTGK